LLSVSAHGALNKWVDAEGKVHYSDEAPPSNVKVQTVAIPSAASGVSALKSVAEREADRKKALKAKDEAEQKAAQQREKDLAKQKNCEGAKSNLRTLQSNSQIATYNDKGERNILDAAARQQGIEDANKQVSTYCN
jgi:hypothetical protein